MSDKYEKAINEINDILRIISTPTEAAIYNIVKFALEEVEEGEQNEKMV